MFSGQTNMSLTIKKKRKLYRTYEWIILLWINFKISNINGNTKTFINIIKKHILFKTIYLMILLIFKNSFKKQIKLFMK